MNWFERQHFVVLLSITMTISSVTKDQASEERVLTSIGQCTGNILLYQYFINYISYGLELALKP